MLDARVVGLTNVGLDHTGAARRHAGADPRREDRRRLARRGGRAWVSSRTSSPSSPRARPQARGARAVLASGREIARSPTACWPPAISARTRRSRSPARGLPRSASARRRQRAQPRSRGGAAGPARAARRARRSSCATARTTRTGCGRSSASSTPRSATGGHGWRSSRCRPTRTVRASSTCSCRTSIASSRPRADTRGRSPREDVAALARAPGPRPSLRRHRGGARGGARSGRSGRRRRDLRHALPALAISGARSGRDRSWVGRCVRRALFLLFMTVVDDRGVLRGRVRGRQAHPVVGILDPRSETASASDLSRDHIQTTRSTASATSSTRATFQALLKLAGFFVIVLWLALAFWTYKDAKRRIADPILVAVAVVTALIFPFVGAMVYAILRPPEYLEDVRERELEIRAMERRLGADPRCPFCRQQIESSFLVCPHCTNRLKSSCRRCRARSSSSGRSARTARRRCSTAPRRSSAAAERPALHRVAAARSRATVGAMPTETTLVLIKPDAVARARRRDPRPLRAPRLPHPRHAAAAARPRDRRAALRRAPRAAVLRRARRLHHLAVRSSRSRSRATSAIATVRTMMGETHPTRSAPGTIRGDLALELAENVVHGSDSPESAQRELALFFGDGCSRSAGDDASVAGDLAARARAVIPAASTAASADPRDLVARPRWTEVHAPRIGCGPCRAPRQRGTGCGSR